jgi:quercetin dioxygenase-like cupin family protein
MFLIGKDLDRDHLDWGSISTVSGPVVNKAKDIVTLHVNLKPGKGHNFHRHPQQEEVIFVLKGHIEQWVDMEMKLLEAGDAAFIGSGVVHASFNIGQNDAQVLAILGPAIGDSGYEVEEVAALSPWNELRSH